MQLINTATAATGIEVASPHAAVYPSGVVQASVPSGATVSIEGRVSTDADWVELDSFTANGIKAVAVTNFMRAVVAGTFSGNAKAWLQTRT